jgi:ATP-dependent helicase/nuclease subunit A
MSGAPRAAGALSRGRAMHAVLERMDLTGPLDAADVRRAVERLVRDEALDEASAALVEPERIAALFAGPLGARIRRDPSRVRREVPVNIAVGSEAWERWTAGDWIEPSRGGDEFVHVQGIVDCVVMEDDGLLLVEYKTDRVHGRDADRRAAFYRPQVVAYAAALGALSGRSPREAVLYFLEPGEARNVDLPW